MESKNSIVTLIQPAPKTDKTYGNKGEELYSDDSFRNILEEANRKVKQTEKENSSKSDSKKEQARSTKNNESSEAAKNTKDKKEISSDKAASKDQKERYEDDFDLKLHETSQKKSINDIKPEPSATNVSESEELIVEKLQAFGLGIETIQSFLVLFDLQKADTETAQFLTALDSQFKIFRQNASDMDLIDFQETAAPINAIKVRELLAMNLLRKAGVDDTKAKKLVQEIIWTATSETDTQELLPEDLGLESFDQLMNVDNQKQETVHKTNINVDSKGRDGKFEITSKDFQNNISSKGRDGKFEITSKDFQDNVIEKSKNEVSRNDGEGRNQNNGARIRVQETTVRPMNQQQQQAVQSDGEARIQISALKFHTAQDSFSMLNQNMTKGNNEAAAQNLPQVSENFTATLKEIKTSESILPKGLSDKGVINQIFQKFSLRGAENNKEIQIKLDPPALGKVRMNISTNGDSVKTTIVAETHGVKQAIENNLSQLKDSFTGQGLKVDSFEVMVGGEHGFEFKDQQQNMAQGSHQHQPVEDFIDQESSKEFLTAPAYSVAEGLSVIV